jgi:hypothetical protein
MLATAAIPFSELSALYVHSASAKLIGEPVGDKSRGCNRDRRSPF